MSSPGHGPTTITLAHSPDPDDVFMWWPVTGMIEPPADAQRVEPARVVSTPEIDTGPYRFVPIAADIAALNRRAVGGPADGSTDLEVTALSVFAWAQVHARYQLTAFGASMGHGYGPKVVARAAERAAGASPACYAGGLSARDAGVRALLEPGALTAVPGKQTTAFLLLSMMLGPAAARLRTVEMPFDRILDAVASGAGGVTHGLLIHQSQLTFTQLGLELVADVGEWWLGRTGLPLPLGGNAVRRDLDARHGPGTTRSVVDLLDRSLRYALQHRERSLEYAMRFAPELSRAQAERYIDMYVSELTVDAGEAGRAAIQRLLDDAVEAGLGPRVGKVELLRAGTP